LRTFKKYSLFRRTNRCKLFAIQAIRIAHK
jgi:hypothetical protein